MASDVLGEEEILLDKKLPENKKGGLPGYERLSAEEQKKKLQEMFREVFQVLMGKLF